MAGEIDRYKQPPKNRIGVPENNSPVLKGFELADKSEVDMYSDHVKKTDPYHINILSTAIPHKLGYSHIFVLGTSNAGKTTTINQILKDMLWHVGRGYGHRTFIWDYKRTARYYLESLPLKVPVHYLDPVDARSSGINWAKEIRTWLDALQFVKNVLHADADPKTNHNFAFITNARSALYQIIRTFQIHARGQWNMTDVVEACSNPDACWKVLRMTPRGRAMKNTIFGSAGQGAGVYFSLHEFAFNFGPIAAALSKVPPERCITLSDWLRSESVLVLGHFEAYETALAPFQQWVFGRLVGHLLSSPDIPHDGTQRTSFFLDEVRNSPFGSKIVKLANSGRSKGAAIVTGVGNIAGLRSVLGNDATEEFIGMFSTKVFLRQDAEGAKWASDFFGKQLRMVRKYNEGESVATAFGSTFSTVERSDIWARRPDPSTTDSYGVTKTPTKGFSYEPTERTVLYPTDFQRLSTGEEPGLGLVVNAYMSVRDLSWREKAAQMRKRTIDANPNTEFLVERDDADFDNECGWGPADYQRLGIADDQPSAPETPGVPSRPLGVPARPQGPQARPQVIQQSFEMAEPQNIGVCFDPGEDYADARWDKMYANDPNLD